MRGANARAVTKLFKITHLYGGWSILSPILVAMGEVVSWGISSFLVFMGMGLLVRRVFSLRITSMRDLTGSFWIGWGFAIAFLQLWHLWFRVDWRPLMMLSVIGLAGLAWGYQEIRDRIRQIASSQVIVLSIILVAGLWLANLAVGPMVHYDSGLYELSAVRWASTYPIIPGLANLHTRLGFNSSYYLYVSLFDIGPWVHKSYHLAGWPLLWVLFAQAIAAIWRPLVEAVRRPNWNRLSETGSTLIMGGFYLLLLVPMARYAMSSVYPSPTCDVPVFVLGIVVSAEVLRFLAKRIESATEAAYAVFYIIVLCAVGITMKLDFAVFGLVSCVLALGTWIVRYRKQTPNIAKSLLIWIAAGSMVLIPWIVRTVILTGYLVFPSAVGPFPVGWRVPHEAALDTANWVFSWARRPGVPWQQVLGNWQWFLPWARRMSKAYLDFVIPLVLSLAGILLGGVFWLSRKCRRQKPGVMWLFLLAPMFALIFWFFTAPGLSFLGSFLWIWAAGAVVLGMSALAPRRYVAVVLVISVALLGSWGFLDHATISKRVLVTKPGTSGGFYSLRGVELDTFRTKSGLLVYRPVTGDRCWDAPLPCTPYPNPSLHLRETGDISSGFAQ